MKLFLSSLLFNTYFAPENDTGSGGAAPAATPAPSADVGTSPSADVSSTPSPATSVPADPSATVAAPPPQPTWLDQMKHHGLPVGANEQETFQQLRRMADERQTLQSIQHLVPVLSEFRQHAKAFTEWQQQQQKAAPSTAKQWYEELGFAPPEYNPAWMQLVQKDAQGNLVPVPGAPADIVAKIQHYAQFQREQIDKFTQNPYEYMAPAIDKRARDIAEKIINERLSAEREKQEIGSFIKQNENWLYELDPNTKQPMQQYTINPMNGQQVAMPVLSHWGQLYAQYAQQAFTEQNQLGYRSEQQAKNFAMTQVQRDFAIWQLNQGQKPGGGLPTSAAPAPAAAPATPAKTPQEQANETFLSKANPPGKARQGGGQQPPAKERPNGRNLFKEMLKKVKATGYDGST